MGGCPVRHSHLPGAPRSCPSPSTPPGARGHPALPQPAAAALSPTTLPPRPSAPERRERARLPPKPRVPPAPLGARGVGGSLSRAPGARGPNLRGPLGSFTPPRLRSSTTRCGLRVTFRPGAESARLLPRQGCTGLGSRQGCAPPPGLRLLSCCRATRPPHLLRGLRCHRHSPHPQRLLPTLTFASRSQGPCVFCTVEGSKRGSDWSRVTRESWPWHKPFH